MCRSGVAFGEYGTFWMTILSNAVVFFFRETQENHKMSITFVLVNSFYNTSIFFFLSYL